MGKIVQGSVLISWYGIYSWRGVGRIAADRPYWVRFRQGDPQTIGHIEPAW